MLHPFKGKIAWLTSFSVLAILSAGILFPGMFFMSFEDQYERVNQLYQDYKLIEAADEVTMLVEKYPNTIRVKELYSDILFARGELHTAKDIAEQLEEIEKNRKYHHRLRIAMIDYYLGDLESAERLANNINSHAFETSDAMLLAGSFYVLGRIKFNQAEYDSSLDYQEKSLEVARSISSDKRIADALRQIGVLHWYRGGHVKARNFYDDALKIYKQIGDKIGEATTVSNIGHLSGTDEWQTNLKHQLVAYDIRKKIGDQIGLADSYYFLAMMPLFSKQGRPLRYNYLEKSYELSHKIGYKWGKDNALLALINSDLMVTNAEFDNDHYYSGLNRKYFERIDSLSGLSVEGEMQRLFGHAFRYANAKEYEKAAEYFWQVHTMRDSLGYNLYSVLAINNYAKSLIKLGEFEQAEAALENALKIAKSRDSERDVALISLPLAEVYHARGRSLQAINILMNLADFYDQLFTEIIEKAHPLTGFQSAVTSVDSWRGNRSNVYELLITIMADLNDPRLFHYIERERALPFWGSRHSNEFIADESLRDSFNEFVNLLTVYDNSPKEFDSIEPLLVQIGELQQAIASQNFKPAKGKLKNSPGTIVRMEELQQVLDPSEVFVSYFVSREKVYVTIIRKGREELFEVVWPEKQLRSVTEVYMQALMRGSSNPGDNLWHASSHKLYTELIEPLVSDSLIRENETIIISPHKSLHLIPFHALPVHEALQEPKFLLERFYIFYTPSASIFVEKRTRERKSLEHCLAVAPEVQNLPFSYREVTEIPSSLFPKITYMTGDDAESDKMLNSFSNYDVVHISSHATMNFMFPNASYIQMADRKLRLHELFNKKMDTQLVVLSSCGSGLGIGTMDPVPIGYDLVSFPRAFLQAGASSVVATLWLVEDQTAMMIMRNFYKNLSALSQHDQSYDFLKALIDAQRQYLAYSNFNGTKNHPFYWAPFVLFGDG